MLTSLSDLLERRSNLLQDLTELGDFQPGSITRVVRRCGKPACHCARPNHPGHGPQVLLTQKVAGKTVTQALSSPAAVRKAENEIAEFRRFRALTQELLSLSRRICRLRPVPERDLSPEEKNRRPPSGKKSLLK
jgi:uncharacterized protein DUF6788